MGGFWNEVVGAVTICVVYKGWDDVVGEGVLC